MNRIALFFGLLAVMLGVAVVVTWKAFTAGGDPPKDSVPAAETRSPDEEESNGETGTGTESK